MPYSYIEISKLYFKSFHVNPHRDKLKTRGRGFKSLIASSGDVVSIHFAGKLSQSKFGNILKNFLYFFGATRKKVKENFGEFCEFPCQNGKSMLLSKYKFCASLA